MTPKLAHNISALLKQHQLSEAELARKINLGQTVIHRIASGETTNPTIDSLMAIANFFSITINQLIGSHPKIGKIQQQPTIKSIPLLSPEQVMDWPNNKQHIKVRSIFHNYNKADKNYFAYTLNDSTMTPSFPPLSQLIINPNARYKNQDYVLVHIYQGNQIIFRQLFVDGNCIYLKPTNPDFHIRTLNQKHDKILGVMIQARLNFDPEFHHTEELETNT